MVMAAMHHAWHDRTPGSTQTHEDLENAGPPVLPLSFPTPLIRIAEHMEFQVRDNITGQIHYAQSIRARTPGSIHSALPDRAYTFLRKLSNSTNGHVHLCSVMRLVDSSEFHGVATCPWKHTNELVALKVSPWKKNRGRYLKDPVIEAAALQHLGDYHPNVLGCLEVLKDNENIYTVMPYCAGGDLYRIITGSKQRVSEDLARFWFQHLLNGITHMQKKGVCHRGLSLENLLVDANGNLTIGGLGLALRVPYTDSNNFGSISDVSEGLIRRLIRAQGRAGNVTYLAPEILAQRPFDGFAVDLWAAGVILFIWIVGSAPFQCAHPSDSRFVRISINGQLSEVIRCLGISMSDEACDLLQKMLYCDPNIRLTLSKVTSHPWMKREQNKGVHPSSTEGLVTPLNSQITSQSVSLNIVGDNFLINRANNWV